MVKRATLLALLTRLIALKALLAGYNPSPAATILVSSASGIWGNSRLIFRRAWPFR